MGIRSKSTTKKSAVRKGSHNTAHTSPRNNHTRTSMYSNMRGRTTYAQATGNGSSATYGKNNTYSNKNNIYSRANAYSQLGSHSSVYGSATGRQSASATGNMRYADNRYAHNLGYSYNNTSEAYDMAYDMPEPTPVTKIRHIVKKNYIKAKEPIPVSIIRTFLTIVVVFALSLTTLAIYAQNSSQREELVDMQTEVSALQESNKYLEESINDNLDLKKIEAEALSLGLQKPAEYQTISISVPKESYTVQYGNTSETPRTLLDTLKNLFKGLR